MKPKTSRRLRTAFASIFLLITLLSVQRTLAAAEDKGLTNDTSYESPTFGYVVEWSDSWEVVEDETMVSDGLDLLALVSDEYGARVDVDSTLANGRTPQEFADNYLSYLQANHDDLVITEADETDAWKDAPAYFVSYDLNTSQALDDYFEVQENGDALILTEIRGGHLTGFAVVESAAATVSVDGDPLFSYFGTADEAATYQSPTFGVAIAYDPSVWTHVDEWTAAENDGRDLIVLENQDIGARIFVENYGDEYDGDVSACRDAAALEVVSHLDAAELLQDENGDDFLGGSGNIAWVAYAFEASDTGNPLVAYIECQTFPDGSGVVVFTLVVAEESFADAYNASLDILESITFTHVANGDSPTSPNSPLDRNNDETGERG